MPPEVVDRLEARRSLEGTWFVTGEIGQLALCFALALFLSAGRGRADRRAERLFHRAASFVERGTRLLRCSSGFAFGALVAGFVTWISASSTWRRIRTR